MIGFVKAPPAIPTNLGKIKLEQKKIFKKEMKESFQPFDQKLQPQVKDALAVSFKSIAILGKEKIAHQKVAERTKKQLSSIFA